MTEAELCPELASHESTREDLKLNRKHNKHTRRKTNRRCRKINLRHVKMHILA